MARESGAPRYCSNCGTGITDSMNYCPVCGVAIQQSTDSWSSAHSSGSTSRYTDREVLEYRIDRALEQGWSLESDLGESAVVTRRSFGSGWDHILIALLTLWWTGGVGNALYAAYCYVTPDRVVLRPNGAKLATGNGGNAGDDSFGPAITLAFAVSLTWFGGLLLIVVGASVGSSLGAVFVLCGLFCMLLGASIVPPVKQRLEQRHSPLKNGRVRSVDERIINEPETPCAGCFDAVGRGIERSYCEEFVLLGVPLTQNKETNCYCRACANGEVTAEEQPGRTPASEPSTTVQYD